MQETIFNRRTSGRTALAVLLSMASNTFLPVTMGLMSTPVMADNTQEMNDPENLFPPSTQSYTLLSGENLQSVAKKFNTTPAELEKANQLRVFSRGISGIKEGDDIDIPVKHSGPSLTEEGDHHEEEQAAQLASQAGSFLSASPDKAAVGNLARNTATDKVGSELQTWLSQFGTAQVSLDADKKFSLKNSQFDVLFPLFEQGNTLLFTQGSIHRTDDHNQGNLGAGLRWYSGEWLAGINTFLDDDMSEDQKRVGFGAEYWRDYLKLAANDYLRVSGWKNATDMSGYESRVANGWDVRAEGWLPAYPQLGGSLTWEQYYGDHVALFGRENLQKNPWAGTAGITYTPLPLISMYVKERAGQSGRSDASLGVNLTYRPGIPLNTQLNSDAVAASRTVGDRHYDLVARNNEIVLDYRKKQHLELSTPAILTGVSSGQVMLDMAVSGNQSPVDIHLLAPELLAHGGKITRISELRYSITLPAWHPGTQPMNTYRIMSEARDREGNRSGVSTTSLVVLERSGLTSFAEGTFSPDKSGAFSDSDYLWGAGDFATVTLKVRDDAGAPVAGLSIKSSLTGNGSQYVNAGEWSDNQDGTYTSKVEVNTSYNPVNKTIEIMPQVNGVNVVNKPVKIIFDALAQYTVTESTPSIAADGKSKSTLTYRAMNDFYSPDNIIVSGPGEEGVRFSGWKKEAPATWSGTVTGTQPGAVTISPTMLGSVNVRKPVLLILTSAVAAEKSMLTTDKHILTEDGVDFATLTYRPVNSAGQPVVGISADRIHLTGTNLSSIREGNWKETGAGVYQSQVTLHNSDTVQLSVLLDGVSGTHSEVTLKGTMMGAKITGFVTMGPGLFGGGVTAFEFSEDSGFPTTAMKGLGFRVEIDGGSLNADYVWQMNTEAKSWVSVDQKGIVTFNAAPPKGAATFSVTATPISGKGTITHRFALKHWFVDDNSPRAWEESRAHCEQAGMRLPAFNELTPAMPGQDTDLNKVGSLLGEWDLEHLLGASRPYWAAEQSSPTEHYIVYPYGDVLTDTSTNSTRSHTMCVKSDI